MDELREEVGIQTCLMVRLVKSRMKWTGHVERMKDDRLPMMAYVHQERGRRKRGRPRMRWRDCIERDMRKGELEDVDWRMVAQDRGQWRRVVHRAAESCSHPHPWNQGNNEERDTWAAHFKELLNGKGAASCLELPSSVRREVDVEEIRQEEVETAMHKIKKASARGR